ncbi:MAG: AAA family ATPase [Verrucomicrobiota bacterium]
MITNIRLSNFRAFQSEVNVRISPITVLIGRNSAGKSSLIKFLLMLRQSLESKSDQFFVTDGKHVQLGTWKDLRHTKTRDPRWRDSQLRFKINVLTSDLPSRDIQSMWRTAANSQIVSETVDKFRLHLEFPKPPITKEAESVDFSIQGRVHYGNQFKYGAHEVWGRLPNNFLFRKYSDKLSRVSFLRFDERSDSLNELLKGVASERFLDTLRHEFLSFRHLSPIREESQQSVQIGSPPPNDVGHRGEYAMPHLAEFFTNIDLRDKADFVQKFAHSVAGVDKLIFKSKLSNLLTHIKGRNINTQALCSLSEFGFGVSQCLPIFVQGAMHAAGQLLIVEQPESQLHPTAQLELGSFFAELWKKRGVPSIIETHSPNILLRLRKLVSKGELATTDVSVAYFDIGKGSKPRIHPYEIFMQQFEMERKGNFPAVVVKNLDINPDGSLGSKGQGLPMEFFSADVIEALDLGANKNV